MQNQTDGDQEGQEIRVLLVDHHEAFARVATDLLQRHDDMVVVGVESRGEQALSEAQRLQPDVILIDLDGPDLIGTDTIARLRAVSPQTRIVGWTLLDPTVWERAELGVGVDAVVSKRSLSADLLPAIRAVLAQAS